MDRKFTKREMEDMSQDVTEPLPGMLSPMDQAYKDKMEKKKKSTPPPTPSPTPEKPKKMKKGGMVGSASKRADGCAQRGKTRGKMV